MSKVHRLLGVFSGLGIVFFSMVLGAAVSSPAVAQESGETINLDVSSTEYNRFVLPVPFETIIFPPGAPVKGEPVPLSDNISFLVQFRKKGPRSTQMIVQAENGRVYSFRLTLKEMPGVVYRVEGARDRAESLRSGAGGAQRSELIRLMKRFTSRRKASEGVDGFSVMGLPATVLFEGFRAVPVEAWEDGVFRVFVFELKAEGEQHLYVSPPQFYRRGVLAVELSSDVISPGETPRLYVITDASEWTGGE